MATVTKDLAHEAWASYLQLYADKGLDYHHLVVGTDKRPVSLKRWFENREGNELYSLNVTVTPSGKPVNHFPFGARIVDHVGATFATLNSSRVDYAGTRVIASDERSILIAYGWGENTRLTIYTENLPR